MEAARPGERRPVLNKTTINHKFMVMLETLIYRFNVKQQGIKQMKVGLSEFNKKRTLLHIKGILESDC